MSDNEPHVKILFRFYSNILDQYTVETLWASPIDQARGLFKIENIPFYVPQIACGDIVFAEKDEIQEMLTYQNTVEPSGNSTIQVVLMDRNQSDSEIQLQFHHLGCNTEGFSNGYFSVEVPSKIDYVPVRKKLLELHEQNLIDFSESCLSASHKY